uniref:Uncharacterized protein n=2 Tax=Janibacter limosus TaxID=53458 RepID=A0AC61U8N7_9MICO|nr:potassium transporter TrkG [Janibacter limosus]
MALVLIVRLRVAYHSDWGAAVYSGVFHAISAFNNAGFGLLPDSAVQWAEDPWMSVPLMLSVMIGGLGFPVWWELLRHWRRPYARWTVHATITIWGSVVLWVAGTVLFAAFEWDNKSTLGPMGTGGKILAATFQSVVARTAGFNSVDIGALRRESLLLLDGLMFIGGGSAGTAGGVKVATFAIPGFVIWAELRGEPTVRVLNRRLSPANMRQALTVALLATGMVVAATGALMVLTPFRLDVVLFEVISAFATVGMSTGITCGHPRCGAGHPRRHDVPRPHRADHAGRRPGAAQPTSTLRGPGGEGPRWLGTTSPSSGWAGSARPSPCARSRRGDACSASTPTRPW